MTVNPRSPVPEWEGRGNSETATALRSTLPHSGSVQQDNGADAGPVTGTWLRQNPAPPPAQLIVVVRLSDEPL